MRLFESALNIALPPIRLLRPPRSQKMSRDSFTSLILMIDQGTEQRAAVAGSRMGAGLFFEAFLDFEEVVGGILEGLETEEKKRTAARGLERVGFALRIVMSKEAAARGLERAGRLEARPEQEVQRA